MNKLTLTIGYFLQQKVSETYENCKEPALFVLSVVATLVACGLCFACIEFYPIWFFYCIGAPLILMGFLIAGGIAIAISCELMEWIERNWEKASQRAELALKKYKNMAS